jgi:MFS family permease
MRLKHQAFFYSLFLSRLADQIILFLVPLVIFQPTGSVAWSGAAFFLETLPRFLSFPICGALCDRQLHTATRRHIRHLLGVILSSHSIKTTI